MKPIELTVQGLHSFRERQTVDFSTLCEGGVFGIFGPTGSGKSSILDAMTLSLYGKVERAPGNTQGILNHAEDTLAVSYTFSLGAGDRRHVYKVERSFKRTKDDSLRSATARLIHEAYEPVVLADKAGDVTKKIEELLGLAIDDFTRAVVLPQGKFSEFLSLKGTERRKMLQRLFHLEKYGDELNFKLKKRLNDTNQQLQLIEREKTGLGDASEEALKKAESAVALLVKRIDRQKAEAEKLQKDYDTASKQMDALHRLKEVSSRKADLDQKKDQFEQIKQNIHHAKEAFVLFPYVKEIYESDEQTNELSEQRQSAEAERRQLKAQLESAAENYEKATVEQQKNELPLKMKLESLYNIKEKQKAVYKREQEAEKTASQLKQFTSGTEKLEKHYNELTDKKNRYEKVQSDLKNDLKKLEHSPDYKKKIHEARELLYSIKHQEQLVKDSFNGLDRLTKEKTEAAEELEKLRKSKEGANGKIAGHFSYIQYWYNHLHEKKKNLERSLHEVEKLKKAKEAHVKSAVIKELQESFADGEACPVCGSSHHGEKPDWAVHQGENRSGSDEELDTIKSTIEKIDKEISEKLWKLDQSAGHTPFTPDHTTAPAEPPGEDTPFPSVTEDSFYDSYGNWQRKWEKEKEGMDKLQQQWENIIISWRGINDEISGKELLFRQLSQRTDEMQEEADGKKEGLHRLLASWENDIPDIPYHEAAEAFSSFQKNEEKAGQIRERLDKSVPVIEDIQKQMSDCQSELQDQKIAKSKLDSDYSAMLSVIEDVKKEIDKVTDGHDVIRLISQHETKLDTILKRVEELKKLFDTAKEEFETKEKEVSNLRERGIEAEKRQKRARERWEQQKTAVFPEPSGVEEKLVSEDKLADMEKQVQTYENSVRDLEIEKKQLNELLKDKNVSEESFKTLETAYEHAKASLEELRTEYGAAAHHMKDVKNKVARYEELEKERKQFTLLSDQLMKLDKVFRGKEFVEFLAEEHLVQVSRLASERLRSLTRGRYAIEVDSAGGFIMRDDANGGVRRSVTTLSGGETFLTSLALALSLSASIQLKGEHALEFFFLDEGFGTLDPELLETVVASLEKLHTDRLSVGVISHVPELKERLPRKLIVTAADHGGKGSRISMETV